jgi:predicted TIM-barrel fold metal-dependent hydrolase
MTSIEDARVVASRLTDCYDADNHMREPIDAFTKYMEPRYRERGWRLERGSDGEQTLWVGAKPLDQDFDVMAIPGSFRNNLRRLRAGESIDPFVGDVGPVLPEYVDRDARLAVMDGQGVRACLMFPSVAVAKIEDYEDPSDPEQSYANLRAVNRYLGGEWGWAYKDRIFTAANLSLLDLGMGLAELDRLLADGVRVVNLVPGPINRMSPADPTFDPFWARINESRTLVTFHTAPASGRAYGQMLAGWWEPTDVNYQRKKLVSGTTSAFMGFQTFNERPIMDTVAALILHNLFGRFPNVRVISVENGTFWVPFTVKLLNKSVAINQGGFWLGGRPERRVSAIFRDHVFVTPFHEENVQGIVDAVGADCVLFGSDFPHAEGLAHPVADYLEDLEVSDPVSVVKIMRDNLKGLLAP